MNKRELLRELLIKLEGLNWCFISGVAVSVYTRNKRKFGDIDILMEERSLDHFAKRLGKPVKKSIQKKGKATIKDCRIELYFLGQRVEAVTNFPRDISQMKIVEKTLKEKVLKDYLGLKVYVTPLEELIAQKSLMLREKDSVDLKLLRNLQFNTELLNEFKALWRTQLK